MVKRWLAVGTSADTIRLIAVSEASAGPDVFVKLFDYEELAARCAELEAALRQMIDPPAGTRWGTGLALRIERARAVLESTADNASAREDEANG